MLRITASSLADSFGQRYELALADGSQRNPDSSNASSASHLDGEKQKLPWNHPGNKRLPNKGYC
jgi:hypothetical protein